MFQIYADAKNTLLVLLAQSFKKELADSAKKHLKSQFYD
jgi:hypothetical protein